MSPDDRVASPVVNALASVHALRASDNRELFLRRLAPLSRPQEARHNLRTRGASAPRLDPATTAAAASWRTWPAPHVTDDPRGFAHGRARYSSLQALRCRSRRGTCITRDSAQLAFSVSFTDAATVRSNGEIRRQAVVRTGQASARVRICAKKVTPHRLERRFAVHHAVC